MNTRPNPETMIDAVACEMTASEPSPAFRARVLGRLDATPRRSWLPVASAIAAAAVVAVLAVLRSPDAVPASDQPTAMTTLAGPRSGSAPTSVSGVSGVPGVPGADSSAKAGMGEPSRPGRVTAPAADELAWLARALPPLPDVPTLAFDPIQPETLSIAPIVVTPLMTEPLSVPPVDAGAGGRHPQS